MYQIDPGRAGFGEKTNESLRAVVDEEQDTEAEEHIVEPFGGRRALKADV